MSKSKTISYKPSSKFFSSIIQRIQEIDENTKMITPLMKLLTGKKYRLLKRSIKEYKLEYNLYANVGFSFVYDLPQLVKNFTNNTLSRKGYSIERIILKNHIREIALDKIDEDINAQQIKYLEKNKYLIKKFILAERISEQIINKLLNNEINLGTIENSKFIQTIHSEIDSLLKSYLAKSKQNKNNNRNEIKINLKEKVFTCLNQPDVKEKVLDKLPRKEMKANRIWNLSSGQVYIKYFSQNYPDKETTIIRYIKKFRNKKSP